MRRRVAVGLLAAIAGCSSTGVLASQVLPQVCGPTFSSDGLSCGGAYDSSQPGTAGATGGSGGSRIPDDWVPYDRLETDSDGKACMTTGYRRPGLVAAEDVNQYDGGTRDPFTVYPRCPANGEETDPAVVAAHHWEERLLPVPEPKIAPGWAITGKLAFLETNGQTTYSYTNQTPLGLLEIRATGRYYVEWGDDESSGPHRSEGKPWPSGTITHDYIWAGTYDVVVTERWTATWSLGGRTGVLRELRTTGRIDDFPVRELQAVVRSGR